MIAEQRNTKARKSLLPSLGVGWSYAMNLMRDSERPDSRPQALLKALHACASREKVG